ncbi:MAG: Xaa-Pro aminopeptidase [Bacteroidetes bacterium HGW-Bacteroidetes-21]|jgi:Xaa-Pro aminopeptidase|nr:MAG: Xaa-Pro aminopeptidase [Bacteroidetes bacterium HGW-Bacteroidetes-21]
MFKSKVYTERRNKLRSLLRDGIVLLMGNVDSPMSYPANIYRFRQDSTFLYFFGLDHPGLAGVIDLDKNDDCIFGDNVEIDDIIWTGYLPTIAEQALEAGVQKTGPLSKLTDVLMSAIDSKRKIHFLPPYRAENKLMLQKLLGIVPDMQKQYASVELKKAVSSLRSIKDDDEIAHLDAIQDVGYLMHTAAMKMARKGVYEREIAGYMEGLALSHGGTISFPVILSKHGEILHGHDHSNKLANGDLLLVDAGFESEMSYATDNTRTFAVGGKFSAQQKGIYNIVLEAINSCIEKIKPGVPYRDIHHHAAITIATGLKELGIMKGDVKEAVAAGAHAMFFPHGLGHMMGLDVHDMEDIGENFVGYDEKTTRSTQFGTAYLRLGRKLQPGFVLTVEPGIYFIPALIEKWKKEIINNAFINFKEVDKYLDFGGIRLEDDVLVTDKGSRMLGKKRIPISIKDVEEITGK